MRHWRHERTHTSHTAAQRRRRDGSSRSAGRNRMRRLLGEHVEFAPRLDGSAQQPAVHSPALPQSRRAGVPGPDLRRHVHEHRVHADAHLHRPRRLNQLRGHPRELPARAQPWRPAGRQRRDERLHRRLHLGRCREDDLYRERAGARRGGPPIAIAKWIRTNPGLRATAPVPVTIGHLHRVVLDITQTRGADIKCARPSPGPGMSRS